MRPIRKHQHVSYRTVGGCAYSAIVRTVHRDGTATVEARFNLNDEGKPRGCYLGYEFRMELSDLMSASAVEDHQS